MKTPVITITEDSVCVHTDRLMVQCSPERFMASLDGEQIDVPVSKLGKDTSDPWINCMAGLAYIIELKL